MAAEHVQGVLRGVDKPSLMLPTGQTPRQLYSVLVDQSRDHLQWSGATVFALDEYIGIEGEDPRSFRFQLWSELCAPLGLTESQLVSPDGMTPDPGLEAARYEDRLQEHQPLTLCIIGVGSNGHVAFNEPGSASDSVTRVARLSQATRADNATAFSGSDVPTEAITVGIQTIMRTARILLLAHGPKKTRAIQKLLASEADNSYPVAFLAEHPSLTVIVDEAALGEKGLPREQD